LINVLIPRRKEQVYLSICHLFPFMVFFEPNFHPKKWEMYANELTVLYVCMHASPHMQRTYYQNF
jgi:hypothetical protein